MIFSGLSKIKKVYIGNIEVKTVFVGTDKVYSSGPPLTDEVTVLKIDVTTGSKMEFGDLGQFGNERPIVNWGDGNEDYQLNHTYTAPGIKEIKIYNSSKLKISPISKGFLKSVLQVSKNLTTFDHIFENCSSLSTLGNNFRIPQGVTNCNSAFANCFMLNYLPDGFEIPEGVTDCFAMFNGCSYLSSVPPTFHLPSTVKSFPSFMNEVNNLYVDIHDLLPSEFKQTGIDCGWAFANASGIGGDAPAELLWDDKTSGKWSRTTDCFKGSGLANLDQIPKEWGGNLEPKPALKTYRVSGFQDETSYMTSDTYPLHLFNGDYVQTSEIPPGIETTETVVYKNGDLYLYLWHNNVDFDAVGGPLSQLGGCFAEWVNEVSAIPSGTQTFEIAINGGMDSYMQDITITEL